MARLFGLIGNRPDLTGRVLGLERDALRVKARGSLGWGVGFYQGGEVLMRRRPGGDYDVVDLSELAADVKGDVMVGHVRSATVGALRTENTHPFRYRQWLLAATGTLPRFDDVRERLLGSVPDFLRGNIRGETDAEVLFHVFLSFLHDAGKLDDRNVAAPAIADALRSTFSVVDGTGAEVGAEPCALNAVVTNGDTVAAVHKTENPLASMAIRELAGRADVDAIVGDDVQLRRRATELGRLHFTLIASDFDEEPRGRWKSVPPGSIALATRADAPVIEKL